METDFVGLLLSLTELTAIVGDRIDPIAAGQNAVLPRMTYANVFGQRTHSHQGFDDLRKRRIQCDLFAMTLTELQGMTAALETIDGYKGTSGGTTFGSILMVNEAKDFSIPPKDGKGRAILRRVVEFDVWVES